MQSEKTGEWTKSAFFPTISISGIKSSWEIDPVIKAREYADTLLASYAPHEQEALKAQFARLTSRQSQEVQPIATDNLGQNLIHLGPPTFIPELASALATWMMKHTLEKNMTFVGFLQAIKSFFERPEDAFYELYKAAFEQRPCSMQTFVHWIVLSATPVWFEGTGLMKASEWPKTSCHDAPAERLTRYLVYREYTRKEQRQKREEEESWLWSGSNDNGKNKDTACSEDAGEKKAAADTWYEQAAQTAQKVDRSEGEQWIDKMAVVLLKALSEYIFFGSTGSEDITYQQRISGERAPSWKKMFSRLLSPYDYFILTRSLPHDALSWSSHERAQRHSDTDLEHQLLFSSRTDGASWQVFANRVIHQGATLIIIKTKEGTLVGGYAEDPWRPATDWYGSSSNFLFRIGMKEDRLPMDTWDGGQGSNNNFQYLNWGKKSLPNGLAMGGQFDYPGLWLDSDFVHGQSKAGPVCTTYQSPQLTETSEFIVDEVEAILVRPVIRDANLGNPGDDGGGVLSRAEDMEFMEMAGKKMYSKDLSEPERQEDDDK